MTKSSLLLSCLLSFFLLTTITSIEAAAKKNSDAPVDMKTAVKTAKIVVNKLAEGEKIDKTWLHVKAKSAIIRQYPQGSEWVVAFKNPEIKKQSHQILYIFLTIGGKYVAANYTGQ